MNFSFGLNVKLKVMKYLFIMVCLIGATSIYSQENLMYVELAGAGPLASVNYERQLTKKPLLNLRAGLGYVTTWDYDGITLPTGIYILEEFKNQNFFELGVNYTFLFDGDKDDIKGFLLPAIGYRNYFKKNKGFLKITFNPVFLNDDPIEIIPWGGVSYGFRF